MTDTDESERLVAPNLSALAYERLERAIMEGEITGSVANFVGV
jgi:hypothetical protein